MKKSSFTLQGISLALVLLASFVTFSVVDPMGWYNTEIAQERVGNSYDRLVAFEPQTKNQSILAYENGHCGFEKTSKLKQVLGGKDSRFFGIPQGRGVYTEYIHLVYVKYFEKVICNGQTYYRAKLDLGAKANSCSYLRKLQACGTDLMERRIYNKMVNRLEILGLGSAGDFKPRRTVQLEHCNCQY